MKRPTASSKVAPLKVSDHGPDPVVQLDLAILALTGEET